MADQTITLKVDKDELIKDIMSNYPESSFCMNCTNYNYETTTFDFEIDEEDGNGIKVYKINMDMLRKGFDTFVQLVVDGKDYKNFSSACLFDASNWDAIDADALVQCSIYGKVIFG